MLHSAKSNRGRRGARQCSLPFLLCTGRCWWAPLSACAPCAGPLSGGVAAGSHLRRAVGALGEHARAEAGAGASTNVPDPKGTLSPGAVSDLLQPAQQRQHVRVHLPPSIAQPMLTLFSFLLCSEHQLLLCKTAFSHPKLSYTEQNP